MKHSLTQKRFPYRRQLAHAPLNTTRKTSRQSTLTQLDFVSTPMSGTGTSDISLSDDEDDLAAMQPLKRRKLKSTERRPRKKANLTQIGFVNSGQIDESDSDLEIIGDSQPTSEVAISPRHLDADGVILDQTILSSPVKMIQRESVRSSRLPDRVSSVSQSITTPKNTRRIELPSSQTPASVALSTGRAHEPGKRLDSSPLQQRSNNISVSPVRVSRSLKRASTVQDSQFEDIALTTQHGRQESSDDDDDDLNDKTCIATMAVYEQCTYDPADSALDRDAARFAMTQMNHASESGRKLSVHDTLSDDERDLVDTRHVSNEAVSLSDTKTAKTGTASIHTSTTGQSADTQAALRPSQVSTVMPTQTSSPPPLVFTSASTERQHEETIVISSSPSLPQPSWNESTWDKTTQIEVPDYSLPPVPPLLWSSSQFSLHSKRS